jgi:hypothetical protein
MIGYSTWGKDGQYRNVTWLDAAYNAVKEARVFYWIRSRHPSRVN